MLLHSNSVDENHSQESTVDRGSLCVFIPLACVLIFTLESIATLTDVLTPSPPR